MNKLAIIVPYRDRAEHLKKFVPHMHSVLKDQKIDFSIFVVEQYDSKPFNKAKLLNIGFHELNKEYDYFCFHDVDMLPVNEDCNYSFIEGACRLSHYVSQFNFIPRPIEEFGGGVIMIDKESFKKVNGFSNEYWGWGVEDNDFSLRCKIKNISISFRTGRYLSLNHEPNGDTNGKSPSEYTVNNRKYFSNIINSDTFFESGISNLQYTKISEERNNFYTTIKVIL